MSGRVLSLTEVSLRTGRSRKTLWNWASLQRRGRLENGFPFCRMGRRLVVRESELDAWLDQNVENNPGRNGDAEKTRQGQAAPGRLG